VRKTPTITNIISPSMQRHMREIDAPAHFLLILRPGVTKLDFIAVADKNHSEVSSLEEYQRIMDQAFEGTLEKIKREGAQSLQDLSNTSSLFKLCHEVVTSARSLAPHLEFSEQQVRAVAVRWLEQESLSLGDVPDSLAGAAARWRVTHNNQSHLRFQDALDWYAEYNCSLSEARHADGDRYDGYDEYGSGRSKTILKIPMSASRPNIVTLLNLKVFIAEHLLAYDQYVRRIGTADTGDPDGEPGLTFFFLPIKGLGQYRAAIDWVGIDGYKLNSMTIQSYLSEQASKLQRLGLESMFTQSLIRSFSTSLRQAFSEMQEEENKSSDALSQAFADLWWANEVRFYKAGQLQNRLSRAEEEDDLTWMTPKDQPSRWDVDWKDYNSSYKEFMAIAGEGHPELTYIKLNLSSFVTRGNNTDGKINQLLANSALDYRDLEKTIGGLPFDEVLFACYFFQPLKEDLAEWVEQLADSVIGIFIEQTVQRTKIVRSRAKIVERLAHWLNGLMRSVGRAGAAKNLTAAMNSLTDQDLSLELLREVGKSLQLMVLAESGASLFRLYGTIDEGDYGHLRKWFTNTSKAEWKEAPAFQKYQQSISHLARAIGGARGHKKIILVADGKTIEYTDSCELDLDELRFPPLAKGEKVNEPILALLPALTEPLENAFNYLDKIGKLGTDTPIRLEMADLRQSELPCILVNIGNPLFEDDEVPETHGLSRAQELLKITELATIGQGEKKDIEGVPYYFVPVRLHPQRLAEKIDQNETNDAGWLCF